MFLSVSAGFSLHIRFKQKVATDISEQKRKIVSNHLQRLCND
jgi:hypothetical protein